MKAKPSELVVVFASIVVAVIAILLFNPQLLTNEKAILKKSLYVTLPFDTKVIYSEGLNGNWLGVGMRFFAYQVDENRWDEFINQSFVSKWNKLPMGDDFKGQAE